MTSTTLTAEQLRVARKLEEKLAKLKAEKLAMLEKKKNYADANRIEFFDRAPGPNPPQEELIEAWKIPELKTFTFTGGNRLGKTTIGAVLAINTCAGRWLWNNEPIAFSHRWPRKIRYVGQDWEKHIKAVVIPALYKWWPDNRKRTVKKNSLGVEAYWTDAMTGSTIEVMSNKQDVDVFEGWDGDLVIYDEPPKREIYIANARGLIDRNGRELFCATLLKEAWIHKDIIKKRMEDGTPDPSVYNVHGETYDNVGYGITLDGVEAFAKKLRPEEKEARLKGIPSYMSGIILKNFNRSKHVVEPFPIPSYWPIDIGIDPHPRKPQAILFIGTNENNMRYVFHEIWNNGDGTMIADWITKFVNRKSLRVNRIVCDPAAKGDDQFDINTTFNKIARKLYAHNWHLETATKDKESGILEINNHLLGPNNQPSIFFFRNCARTIEEAENWMYDDNGKPIKEDDDFMENLYRLLLLNTQYTEPIELGPDERDPRHDRGVSPITGY